jgi:hypothetical protein
VPPYYEQRFQASYGGSGRPLGKVLVLYGLMFGCMFWSRFQRAANAVVDRWDPEWDRICLWQVLPVRSDSSLATSASDLRLRNTYLLIAEQLHQWGG